MHDHRGHVHHDHDQALHAEHAAAPRPRKPRDPKSKTDAQAKTETKPETKPETRPETRLSARNTRQRDAVAKALRLANAPVSAKQILALASKDAKGMGLATVYRTLKLLIETGEAQSVDIPGLTPLFEIAGKGHHHHFVCTDCKTVFELEGECCGHFEELAPAGFRTVSHELSLYGTCSDCSPAHPKRVTASPRKKR